MSQVSTSKLAQGTKAAIGVVLLAMLLAGLGLVLAIRHTQLLADRPVNEARGQAERLIRDLHRQVSLRVTETLLLVAEACRRNLAAGRLDDDPMGGERRPVWLGDLFYYDGRTLRVWPGHAQPGTLGSRDPQRDARLKSLAGATLTQQLSLARLLPETDEAILQADRLGDEPVLLAYLLVDADDTEPFIVAAMLDLNRLRDRFLAPLLSSMSERTRLADAGTSSPAWSEPMTPAMPFWVLQPTPEFVQRVRSGVRRQTGIIIGVTILALVALWGVVWGLIHVVRREVALSQLKSSFVADVSHELKTPLALIRLFGETLAEGRVTSPEKRQEYYQIITRESTRLTNLINNILDFARIDAGRKQYKMEVLDVGQLVRSTYESYRLDLDHHRFEHHLAVAPDLPEIHGDADAISQVLLNLMSNAIKYCDDERYLGVEVAAETRRGRHGVLISVQDRGIGIRPEVRRRLFEGFFRASDDRVRSQRGAGLGLALAKHIVDAHGGSIDIESRLVKGSTFRIFLPQDAE